MGSSEAESASAVEVEDWWQSFYDEAFAEVVLDIGEDARAAETAAGLWRLLRLHPGATVFEQGCGLGRVSIPLSRLGVRVVGVDLVPEYIARADAAAGAEGLPCRFVAADAFVYCPEQPCDAAFNWWSSFGYASDDERNLEMLRRAWEAVRPGGYFALDYYSVPRLLREFQDRVMLTYRTRAGEFAVTREARTDFRTGMIEQAWHYVDPRGLAHRKHSRTRMYMPHELCALLRRAGFRNPELFEDAAGNPFSLDSSRCVVIAQRGG
jgi:SAM-dependent methyltransferase